MARVTAIVAVCAGLAAVALSAREQSATAARIGQNVMVTAAAVVKTPHR